MKQIMLGALRLVGSALRAVFVGVIAVAMIAGGVAVANYALTQGSGTNFASVVISTVHYAAGLLCDATVGTTQCAAVTASNALKVDGSAVTQPVSGTVTANAGTNLNTSALATSANQATNGATTAHTCAVAGYSEIGCLGQIDDDVKSPIAAGTNTIGGVTLQSVNITPTDCSGSITTGGTAQNAFTAQTTLHGFTIANIDSTSGSGEPLWISFTTTAAASTVASYPLAAPTATTFANLTSFTAPPGFGLNHALSVIGATTGHKFSCTWW